MRLILLALIGVLSGIVSGMGIGGGTILIPALTVFFGIDQQAAQNINLIYFIPTALMALTTHFKNGSVEKSVLWRIVLPGIIGAIIGSYIAVRIDALMLRKIFGFFLLAMGLLEIFKKEES